MSIERTFEEFSRRVVWQVEIQSRVSFAEYSLLYRALLQNRHVISRSLLIFKEGWVVWQVEIRALKQNLKIRLAEFYPKICSLHFNSKFYSGLATQNSIRDVLSLPLVLWISSKFYSKFHFCSPNSTQNSTQNYTCARQILLKILLKVTLVLAKFYSKFPSLLQVLLEIAIKLNFETIQRVEWNVWHVGERRHTEKKTL